jgi:hypothetical protein
MMRNQIFRFVIVFGVLLIGMSGLKAQCDTFLPNGCKAALGNFIHDGGLNAAQLTEGETAELFKTFFAGQIYRMVVCKADDLPPVHVRVLDNSGRILFDNKNFNYEQVWDFSVKSTQMLSIQMYVVAKSSDKQKYKKGCVSIIFGVDPKS